MKWWLIIGAVVVVAVIALLVFGLTQPVKHSVARSIRLRQKPDAVFAVIDDFQNSADGSSVVKVEAISDRNGNPASRYTLKWRRLRMTMTQLERTPPTRLVSSLTREDGAALGTWTYEIVPDGEGCRVTLAEDGELKNPLFRALMRLRGADAHITQTLRELAKKFGEAAEIKAETNGTQ